jgi:hypothetical protein
MSRYFGTLVAAVLSCIPSTAARASGDNAKVILDRAIEALGGEEKLSKIEGLSWTSNGSVKENGRVREITAVVTFQGLNRVRRDYRVYRARSRTVLNGDKGWHVSDRYRPMNADAVAREKRNIYLQLVPTLLVPLKGAGFKYEAAGEEKVRGKPASILKITAPDGKDFTLSFDNESFLPVKEVARSIGNDGKERVEEATFSRYHHLGGIKKATLIEVEIDAQNLSVFEIVDFKVLDRVPADTFTPPN